MTLREPPKPPGATRALVGRMVGLVVLLALFAGVVWVATTNGQIPLVERANPFVEPPGEHINVEGSAIHVRTFGPQSGETVVLIHDDSVAGGATLVHVAELVGEQGSRVVVPDMVGFGLSERPDDPGRVYTVAGQADVLGGLLDQMGVTSARVAGFGWGGGLATELAVTRPDLVARLVLVDTLALPPATSGWDTLEGLPFGVGRAVAYTIEGATSTARERFFAGCQEGGWCDWPALVEGHRRAVEVPGTAQSIRARRASENASVASDRLGEIDIPVVIVWSAASERVPADAEEMAARFPDAEVVAIQGVAGRAHLNAPTEVAAVVGPT